MSNILTIPEIFSEDNKNKAREQGLKVAQIGVAFDGITLNAYLNDRSHVSFIFGPLGSGKTVASIVKLWLLISEMPVSYGTETDRAPKGLRRSRWGVIRNTKAELERSTIKDWKEIFPEEVAPVVSSPTRTYSPIRCALPDGTIIDAEVEFIAMDRPDATKRIRGTNFTGFYFNEMTEIYYGHFEMALGRAGRFPGFTKAPPYWFGVIADYNAPDEDHRLYAEREQRVPDKRKFRRLVGYIPNGGSVVRWVHGKVPADPHHPANDPSRPDNFNWSFFKQPGGVILEDDGVTWTKNPDAENLKYLPRGYYDRQIAGKTWDWVNVNLANNYGSVIQGKPVHPQFNSKIHRRRCKPTSHELQTGTLIIGVDGGRTPSAEIAIKTNDGYNYFDEYVTENTSVQKFAEELKSFLLSKYGIQPKRISTLWCDPAMNNKGEQVDTTSILMLRSVGFNAIPCITNEVGVRRASMEGVLSRMRTDGTPAIAIDPDCKKLLGGLQGKFCYRRLQVAGAIDRYADEPEKNEFSHPVEAAEYLLTGCGEGHRHLATISHQDMVSGNRSGYKHTDYSYRD